MTFQYEKNVFSLGKISADVVVFAPDSLSIGGEQALKATLSQGADAAVFRTSPYEAAFYCDPITLDAFSAYNCAFAVKAEVLKKLGRPKRLFGVAAANELIARMRQSGCDVKYAPNIVAVVKDSPEPKYIDALFSSLYMREKFGSRNDVINGIKLVFKAIRHPKAYGTPLLPCILRGVGADFATLWLLLLRATKNRKYKGTLEFGETPSLGFSRGSYIFEASREKPLVSLITRTRNRPETLRKTLESLRHQTYKNFEVVVVEDGEPLAEEMIKADFSNLRITYKATVENIGRAAAANLGFSLAKGEYLNLLDDDDYLLPEHIELGVARAIGDKADVVFLRGIALETNKTGDVPYSFEIKAKRMLDFPRIEPFTMVRRCVTTQNGVMFKKKLCDAVGGMRSELGAHEDWNLFLRLMAKGSYTVLPYATCLYIVPADRQAEKKRLLEYSKFDGELLHDETLVFSSTKEEIAGYKRSVANDYLYLLSLGLADERLDDEYKKAKSLYGDKKPLSFAECLKNGKERLKGEELKELYYSEILCFEEYRKSGNLEEKLMENARE